MDCPCCSSNGYVSAAKEGLGETEGKEEEGLCSDNLKSFPDTCSISEDNAEPLLRDFDGTDRGGGAGKYRNSRVSRVTFQE